MVDIGRHEHETHDILTSIYWFC